MKRRALATLMWAAPAVAVVIAVATWRASLPVAGPGSPAGMGRPGMLLLGGLAMGLLVAGLLLSMIRTREEATALARSMTESLRASEERYRSVVSSIAEVIFQIDAAGRIVFLNPAWRHVTGFEIEGSLGRPLEHFIAEEDRRTTLDRLNGICWGKRREARFEVRCRTRELAYRWLEVVAHAATPHDDEIPRAVAGVIRDVTDRRRTQALVAGQRRVFELLATGEPIGKVLESLARSVEEQNPEIRCSILLVDPSGRVLRNGAAPSLPDEYTRQIDGVPIGPNVGSCGTAVWSRKRVVVSDIETDPLWADFRHIPLAFGLRACWSQPIVGRSGTVLGTFALYYLRPCEPTHEELALIEDGARIAGIAIERRRQEADLGLARDQAVAAARLKSEFLANTSHELRTPLNGVIGMTELALESRPGPEVEECLLAVRSSARHLLGIIDEILDFSRLEAGKLELDASAFDPRDLLTETLRPLEIRARSKGLRVGWSVSDDVPLVLVGDPRRLRQILINLVGNAVKFTNEGSVDVALHLTAKLDNEVEIECEVRDTGIGVPEGKHVLIFDPFTQADGSATRRFGGTGLGLAIAKQLVELMGGRIGVESRSDGGSVFRFTARVGTAEPEAAPPDARSGGEAVALLSAASEGVGDLPEALATRTASADDSHLEYDAASPPEEGEPAGRNTT